MFSEIALYVHIPFCTSKCTYCDFFSVPCNSTVPDEYIDAVINEAKYIKKNYNIHSWKTIYIGGGTPSLLNENQLLKLFTNLFNISEKKPIEVTIEVNPCDINESFLKILHSLGVNRISCGIQSFSQKVLSKVNRRSSREDIFFALDCLRENWQNLISVDLISALPEETNESFLEALKKIISYKIDHISLYALTIQEGTVLQKEIETGKIQYDFETSDDKWLLARDFLLKNKYEQYEISNFCIDNKQCIHNLIYWQLESYAGIGCNATGTFYTKNNSKRITNTTNISDYINFWNISTKEEKINIPCTIEYIDKKTQSFEFLMLGFRTLLGVCEEKYIYRFGQFSNNIKEVFSSWINSNKMIYSEKNNLHYYSLTKDSIIFLNELLRELL